MRKANLFLTAMFLIATTALTAQQGDIVTMKASYMTFAQIVVKYTGTIGDIKANGVPLTNGSNIMPNSDSTITITTTGNIQLTYLDVYSNSLTQLNISQAVYLDTLYCYYNQLTQLDVSKNTALIALHCYYNQLSQLDVSKNTALKDLQCENNQLSQLDITNNTALIRLACFDNQLSQLDVSKNTALSYLYCDNNYLSSLDLSQNQQLTVLHAHGQNVEVILEDFFTFFNPIYYRNLTAVENVKINDKAYAYNSPVFKPSGNMVRFTTDNTISGYPYGGFIYLVTGTSIAENTASNISLYPNPVQHTLYITSSEMVEHVSIYDISGRMLQQTNNGTVIARSIARNEQNDVAIHNENAQSIDISNLANGIYLVKARTAQGESIRKIVINK